MLFEEWQAQILSYLVDGLVRLDGASTCRIWNLTRSRFGKGYLRLIGRTIYWPDLLSACVFNDG